MGDLESGRKTMIKLVSLSRIEEESAGAISVSRDNSEIIEEENEAGSKEVNPSKED